MESFYLNHLADLGWIIYAIIFIAMLFEGEVVMFTTTYLAEDGFLELRYLLPILFIGAITGDSVWYWMGGKIERDHPTIRHWFDKITKPIHSKLEQSPNLVIFISKFTYGLNRATLMRAGTHPMGFKNFIRIEFFTIVCWMSIIGNLAWISAKSAIYMKEYIKYVEIGLLLGIISMYIVVHIFSVISRKWIGINGGKKD